MSLRVWIFGPDATGRQNRKLQRELVSALKESQEHSKRLAETLDRVIAPRYDPPAHLPIPVAASHGMQPMADVLSIEDDGDFVEEMSK